MPRISNTAAALATLAVVDLISVGGVIALHASLGDTVPVAVHVAETLVVGALGGACAYLIWKFLGRPDPAPAPVVIKEPANDAELTRLREETAENLRVLQNDIATLGTAILKRLPVKPEHDDEPAKIDAVATSINDLALSLIEARESLANVGGDVTEAKSAVFEMQAQIDQQADALRALEHRIAVEPPVPASPLRTTEPEYDYGIGAAPGSIGKALSFGVTGSAVARLIGGAAPARTEQESLALDTLPPVAPLASTDIEGAYDTGEEIPPAATEDLDTMEPEWEAPGEDYPELREPLPHTFAREIAPESPSLLDGAEEPLARLDDAIGLDLDSLEAVPEKTPDAPRRPRPPGINETAIIAHVHLGAGDIPYLRGIGGGLSPLKGVPMEFVDFGRWQWISPSIGEPATVSLWKNDEEPADGDLIEIPAGFTVEVRPQFEL